LVTPKTLFPWLCPLRAHSVFPFFGTPTFPRIHLSFCFVHWPSDLLISSRTSLLYSPSASTLVPKMSFTTVTDFLEILSIFTPVTFSSFSTRYAQGQLRLYHMDKKPPFFPPAVLSPRPAIPKFHWSPAINHSSSR